MSNRLLKYDDHENDEDNQYAKQNNVINELRYVHKQQNPKRPGWSNRREFLLSCIGYAVGLGNIWRFPWLAQKNGGGAFLVPYFVMLFLEGIPVFYMELTIGQRMQAGPLQLWTKTSRYSKGIGWAAMVGGIASNTSYVMVVAWSLYYLMASFQNPLPWSSCPKESFFNTALNRTLERENLDCSKIGVTQYYWYYETLKISSGMTDFGGLNWKLVLCLMVSWLLIVLSLWRGIRTSGKVVYFTAIFPYIVLSIFFVRGFFLEGYDDGLRHLFTPDWSKLLDYNVWVEAAAQIFYTLSIGFGGLLTYASYNPIHEDTLHDTIIIVSINCMTSIFAGVAIFSMLGYRANYLSKRCITENAAMVTQLYSTANETFHSNFNVSSMSSNDTDAAIKSIVEQQKLNITMPECSVQSFLDKSSSGTGLAFIALTEVINELPGSHFFSVIFFLMLITLGLDSMFGVAEAVSTSIKDSKRFNHVRGELIIGSIAVISAAVGLIYTTDAGEYYVQLNNTYGTDIPMLLLVFCELITISYLYGINRFCDDIKFMTGRNTSIIWKILWVAVCPMLIAGLLGIFLYGTIKSDATYDAWDRVLLTQVATPYPIPALVFAIAMVVIVISFIPVCGIMELCKKRRGNRRKFIISELESFQ